MAKITGIGGVFFKSKGDSAALAAWYQKHLGMSLADFGGAILRWPDDKAEDQGLTVWHVADKDSQWFSPSDSPFMINYRLTTSTSCSLNSVQVESKLSVARNRMKTASSPGSWTWREIRWSCGSR